MCQEAETGRTEEATFLACVCAHQPVSGDDLRLELALLSAPIGLELPTVTQTYQLHLTHLQT